MAHPSPPPSDLRDGSGAISVGGIHASAEEDPHKVGMIQRFSE
jgi:hypothetical protein